MKQEKSLIKISRFTLIELLVVIAIIAILAAMLLPALGSVQEKGRVMTCINNEKQMGMAIMTYCQTFNDWWPCAQHKKSQFRQVMVKELKLIDKKQIGCPSDKTRTPGVHFNPDYGKEYNYSYGVNEKTVGTDYEGQPDRPKRKKISSLKKASSTILMVEKNKKSEPMYQLVWQAFSNDVSRAATFNHKDGINHGKIINFLYCDGHAASATYSAWYNTIRGQGDATNERYLSLHYNY